MMIEGKGAVETNKAHVLHQQQKERERERQQTLHDVKIAMMNQEDT